MRDSMRLLKKILLVLLASAVTSLAAPPPQKRTGPERLLGIDRPSDAAGAFTIWPGSGVPADSETWTWHEQTLHVPGFTGPSGMARNVVVPTVTVFQPEPGTAHGTALIVAPGGAFRFLMMDKEGYDMARWLARRGVTAFVLRYRLAHMPESDADMLAFMQNLVKVLPQQARTEEAPPVGDEPSEAARAWAEEDGRQTIRFIRRNASRWALNADRIGIAGFSAGGGVAVSAAMKHDAESRPDFVAGIYPGYRRGIVAPADAPPLFIAIGDEDILVPPISGARLYEARHKAGRVAELHIFARGQHGFGMSQQHLPSDAWADIFERWLASLGLLTPAAQQGGAR
jgi:acetyl esterase/lipase